jgi:hypothetical protein
MDQDNAMCLQTSVTVCSFVIASIAVHMMKHKGVCVTSSCFLSLLSFAFRPVDVSILVRS